MTIEQMKYLVTTAECGSISNAAQNLFISQPHLSKSIQSAERELGYPIFQRTHQGVLLSENGRAFMRHCSVIVQEYERAVTLSSKKVLRSFHLSVDVICWVSDVFARLCAACQDGDVIDMQLHYRETRQTIEDVCQGTSHLGLVLVKETDLLQFKRNMGRWGLNTQRLHHINMVVALRKSHPILQEGTIDWKRLLKYPFIDYGNRIISMQTQFQVPEIPIDRQKSIVVENQDAGHIIVSNTDAFEIVCSLPANVLERFNIVSVPIDNPGYAIVALRQTEMPFETEESLCYQYLSEYMEQLESELY